MQKVCGNCAWAKNTSTVNCTYGKMKTPWFGMSINASF